MQANNASEMAVKKWSKQHPGERIAANSEEAHRTRLRIPKLIEYQPQILGYSNCMQ